MAKNKHHGTLAERKKVAERFRTYRAKMMLSQQELSQLLDLDRSTISDIENAKHMPYYSTMRRFVALEMRDAKIPAKIPRGSR